MYKQKFENFPKSSAASSVYHVLGKGLSVSGYHVNHSNCIQAGSLDDLVTHSSRVYIYLHGSVP